MGRKKRDRSNLQMQSFELTKPLRERLEKEADKFNLNLSAVIRMILEQYFENKH